MNLSVTPIVSVEWCAKITPILLAAVGGGGGDPSMKKDVLGIVCLFTMDIIYSPPITSDSISLLRACL